MPWRIGRWPRAALLLFLLFAVPAGRAEAGEAHVAVLLSHRGGPADEILQGFRKHLVGRGIRARYSVHSLGGSPGGEAEALREVRAARPDLLFTLGVLAADAAKRGLADIPGVAGMIPRADALRKGAGLAVVQLEYPVDVQLRWLKRVLPDARAVGVVYNGAENQGRIEAAARAARGLGLSIEAREVSSPRDIPAALESLGDRADVLWGLYDSVVLTPETARQILLFSFRRQVPVVGPSAAWVRAGALFALEWDYGDLGAQCGDLAVEIIGGRPPGTFSPAMPRKPVYVINMNSARQIGIDIPETIARGARQTFRGGE